MTDNEPQRCIEQRRLPRDHDLNEMFGMLRDIVTQISTLSTRIDTKVDGLTADLEAHTRVEEEGLVRFTAALNELTERVDEIAEVHTAFPKDEEGTRDFKGHRHYHARLNAGEEKQDDFWSRMKEEVGKNVVTAILIIFALGINSYINKISHETPPQHETAKQDK